MIKEEMLERLNQYCDSVDENCTGCLFKPNNPCPVHYTDDNEQLEEAYKKVFGDKEMEHDNINQPQHYTQGGMECIDEMELIFGREAVENFCLLNAWKYRKRALYKNGEEDIKKSDWYIQKYKELTDESTEQAEYPKCRGGIECTYKYNDQGELIEYKDSTGRDYNFNDQPNL